jgi:hypothetical protein
MSKHKKTHNKKLDELPPERPSATRAQASNDQLKPTVDPRKTSNKTPQIRSRPMTEQMEKATQSLMQLCEEMNNFARASIDANLRSVTAAAKGWDESSRSASHMLQENISRMLSAGKTIAEAKSVRDVVTMQQDFMKDCMDLWMASTTRMSEISARTAKDVVEPVAQHANDSITRVMQKARNTQAA